MDFLIGVLVILFSLVIGIIPFFLLHGFADVLAYFLHKVIKYRRDVVESNLRKTFPAFDDETIRDLTRKFYKNLGDIAIEGIKAFTMSRRQIIRRHLVLNPELIGDFYNEGRSVIACPCHYGNWEWGSLSGGLQLPQRMVLMYKPLNNKVLDKYLRWSRSKYGSQLASIYETAKYFTNFSPSNTVFVMAADQSPSNTAKAIWVDFLGRDTAFLHGPEFYARKFDLPVVYVDIRRVKRGYYELFLELITDDPGAMKAGEITQRYADKLAASIRKQPENWLWSHRRWKHVRK